MSSRDIPEDVLRFLAEKIDTVPHLEVLLLLAENPARDWSVEEVAARIYASREATGAVLKDLLNRHFLQSSGAPLGYRYDPAWDPQGTLMTQVSATYRRQLVQVATYLHSKAPSSVREFARAFDFKKDR